MYTLVFILVALLVAVLTSASNFRRIGDLPQSLPAKFECEVVLCSGCIRVIERAYQPACTGKHRCR